MTYAEVVTKVLDPDQGRLLEGRYVEVLRERMTFLSD